MSGFEGKSRIAAAQFRWWGKTVQRLGELGKQTTPVPAWRSGGYGIVCVVCDVAGRAIEETSEENCAETRSARRDSIFV